MIDSPQVNSETCCATAPFVSILIPTYNQANLIDKAISSALMQDFSAFEVIVIDDTSSDGTEAVCQKWLTDPRFRYVRNPVNLGRVANYRHALYDLALGDWALMLDGDDYLTDPSFIRSAWETAQRYQDNGIVFVQAGHRVHFLDGSRIDVDILPEIDSDEILLKSGEYLRFVYEKSFFTHLGILFNRSAAIKNACYTANISSSDMVSFLGLSLQGSVVLMNKIAGCWVQHGNNTSANLPVKDIADNVKIFRDIADIAIKNGLISKSYINPALTKYEAQTLAFLFASSIDKTSYHPLDVLRLIPMVITINPNLIFNLTLIKASLRCFIKLTIVLVKRLI
jgi:glycosyltransferase involved in cell wall biosynthesis